MSYPAPTRSAHARFCKAEGWQVVRSATGKRNTHHDTYELSLGNGDVLRTRVSRPANKETYGPSAWAHILRDQLAVTEGEFWDCAERGIVPARGQAPVSSQRGTPIGVLYQLKQQVGLSEAEIAALSRVEAIERLDEFWATGQ